MKLTQDLIDDIEVDQCGVEVNRMMIQLFIEYLGDKPNSDDLENLIKLCTDVQHQKKISYLETMGVSDSEIEKVQSKIDLYKSLVEKYALSDLRQRKTSQIGKTTVRGLYIARREPNLNKFSQKIFELIKIILIKLEVSKESIRDTFLKNIPPQSDFPKNVTLKPIVTILYTLRPDAFPLINDYVKDGLNFLSDGVRDLLSEGIIEKDAELYIKLAHEIDEFAIKQNIDGKVFGVIDRVLARYKSSPEELKVIFDNNESNTTNTEQIRESTVSPKNQILYGAAGTGKTFHTINKALEIIDSDFLAKNEKNRKALKDRFDQLINNENDKRIRFVTFHQSFSYEDFVEGISAKTENGKLSYEPSDGVFKMICDDAIRPRELERELKINANPRVWKISIENNEARKYCFEHGEARIGWSYLGNLLDEELEGNDKFKELSSKTQGTLNYFSRSIRVGDILLCLKSVTEISAIGVVESDYIYDQNVPQSFDKDYKNVRKVNWLLKGLNFNILSLNDDTQLTLQTVYQLSRIKWTDLVTELDKNGIKIPISTSSQPKEKRPYVLIIDEINRGNISRIFGELITLIEDTKRAGQDESLKVILPYSKKEFSVPDNVYIIGTMNSSDRSLTGLDIALRRRFTFIEMQPDPSQLEGINISNGEDNLSIQKLLEVMNQRIEILLDRDHCIGHAYFMPLKAEQKRTLPELAQIFQQKILPLLQEYFYDDWERIDWVLNCNGMVKQQFQETDIEKLFPKSAHGKLQNQSWKVNPDEFEKIQNYLKIIGESQ